MPQVATLGGTNLPSQFSYGFMPQKRLNTIQTAGAVVIQKAPEIVPGDTIIHFDCDACCISEWQFFFDLWNDATHPDIAFVGYWGDSFSVKFHALDTPRPRGRLFDISGSLLILTVTAWHA